MTYEFASDGKYIMVTINGNIDTAESTKRLDNEISNLIVKGNHHFIFNLAKTTYLDSAGISIFIHCLCDVQENKGSIFIVAQDLQVRRVLEMVGINRLIKTFESMADFKTAEKHGALQL